MGLARHYEALRLHTPRSLSALPGLRFSSTGPYPDRAEVLTYLAEYARLFNLEIDRGREATALLREDGGWRVETSGGSCRARHVVLATGSFMAPREPDWPGRELFQGDGSGRRTSGAATAGVSGACSSSAWETRRRIS